MIYISNPSIVCAKSKNTNEFMYNLQNQKNLQTIVKFSNKDFCVGKIDFELAKIKNIKYKTRTNEILLTACLNIENDIINASKKYKKIAVVIGTTTIGVEENYNAFSNGILNKTLYGEERHEFSSPAIFLSEYFQLNYIAYAISSACTSGSKAIIEGCKLLENNLADCVICGGVDSLTTLTIKGFDSLGILSEKPCKPFSKHRNGTNISEGAAIFILTKDEINQVKIKSFASSCDAFHATMPDINATHQSRIMLEAFKKSKLKTLDYINLHGTATIANDIMESKACHDTFANTPATSIKAYLGHTLGAAGAIELAYCVESISKQIVIKPALIDEFDDSLNKFNLLKNDIYINNAMSLSFAFGGDNTCLVVSDE